MTAAPQALAGVKVVEFGGYAAGPHVGKMLANFGADVVHLESRGRPDGFRLEYPPFKDGVAGINRSGCFALFNDSKCGATLDLKNPDGLALARRLTDWADIVIENMRPGVMARIGLSYDTLSKTNPGLVMLSTCNMGQTGPRAHTPGFGTQLSSLAGFCGTIGEPDGPPMLLYGPYIDFVASLMGCSAVLAALDRKRRSGKGSWIDVAQYECGLHFMAGALSAYHRDGTIAGRNGNRDSDATPHGAYRCRGGRWLALSCWSDEEFAVLARVLGSDAMTADRRFTDAAARRRHAAELDEALGELLAERDADATAAALQRAGVPAYPVNTVEDIFSDPQLRQRRTWRRRRHEEMGCRAYLMPGFDLSATPGDIRGPAPLLGGDNDRVFREFLGLSDEEITALDARKAFS